MDYIGATTFLGTDASLGFTWKNLTFRNFNGPNSRGFFGQLNDYTIIRDIHVKGSIFSRGGCISQTLSEFVIIEDCSVLASSYSKINAGSDGTGALYGKGYYSKRCHVAGTDLSIDGSDDYLGGAIGDARNFQHGVTSNIIGKFYNINNYAGGLMGNFAAGSNYGASSGFYAAGGFNVTNTSGS